MLPGRQVILPAARYEADCNTSGLSGTVTAIAGAMLAATRRPPPNREAALRATVR